jgi:hypothetical protein
MYGIFRSQTKVRIIQGVNPEYSAACAMFKPRTAGGTSAGAGITTGIMGDDIFFFGLDKAHLLIEFQKVRAFRQALRG